MKAQTSREASPAPAGGPLPNKPGSAGKWVSALAWIAALGLAAFAIYLGYITFAKQPARGLAAPAGERPPEAQPAALLVLQSDDSEAALPEFRPGEILPAVIRRSSLHTIIPNRPRTDVKKYVVETGDSVFEIAAKFNIKPETVLWANYDLLNDSPDTISLGMELQIPPVDGVYYQWQEGDTVEAVAAKFEARVEDVLGWPANNFDLTNPTAEPGTWIMVPGGHREFRQWIIPTIPRGRAGVSSSLYGAGACEGSYDGAYGTGTFVWPVGSHGLSGNDYWDGHLAVDLGAAEGAHIVASDSGVVVFAGWANGGYGNMVMLDHGNGYQTLYAHLSSVATRCGSSVSQGGLIGYAGSTGNSTGPHLHFEVRYQGGFISPWNVLPAP